MSANLYTHRDANIRKTWFLMTVFLAIVIAIGWVFAQAYGNPLIVYIAIGFSLIMNFVSYWYSDKIALSVSGAKEADPKEYLELHRIVENLAITAGLPKPRVYIIPDDAPNAFATGRDPENSAVAVTSGLLHMMERSELEGVIAHELSHIGNRDILVATVVVVLVGFIALISDLFLRNLMFGGRRDDNGKAGAIILIVGLALAILAPIAVKLIQLAVSRKREFLADSSGALLTRYPEGLASALRKISNYGRPMKKANRATAHMFISSPFGAKSSKFLKKAFSTHPPVEERIEALLGNSRA